MIFPQDLTPIAAPQSGWLLAKDHRATQSPVLEFLHVSQHEYYTAL
jgi:hypothetical protein